ncbi:MAG: RAMP superfamily CRISPR-associated protein [Desulfococcaceae bacterium]|jgi:hypothetical protein|nr:RAMP superfamily CRISPR-associated protein [Desulfococcaceae bacterium]
MHFMNPFEFVPLPESGPKELPPELYEGPRLEGFLSYSIKALTPLHITGSTASASSGSFERKEFYENYGTRVIPGASVRGMLSAFIEALTGSDLRVFTRGYEVGKSGIPAYGKHYKNRHTGFLMAAGDDKDKRITAARNNKKIYKYSETLPKGFGRHLKTDAARFLFGYVDEESGEEQGAGAGRLSFEDLLIPPEIKMKTCYAWDLKGRAIMGGPNPRANTAWYFTPAPGKIHSRKVRGKILWEVPADKVRGRKFYFHQEPENCHEEYRRWRQWMELEKYDVESLAPGEEITGGRIYFSDLPEAMLNLLVFSLVLEKGMVHKLGALKPFGFGSVQLIPDGLLCRDMKNPLAPLKEPEQLKFKVNPVLFDGQARRFLERIMYFPRTVQENRDRVFVYPPFRTNEKTDGEKAGFAMLPEIKAEKKGIKHPEPGDIKKITLFFDHYQTTAVNFEQVMGGKDYSHLRVES